MSTPNELSAAIEPRRFDMTAVPARLASVGDPLAGMMDERPDIPRASAAIEKWIGR